VGGFVKFFRTGVWRGRGLLGDLFLLTGGRGCGILWLGFVVCLQRWGGGKGAGYLGCWVGSNAEYQTVRRDIEDAVPYGNLGDCTGRGKIQIVCWGLLFLRLLYVGRRPRCPARTGLQDGEKYKLFVGGCYFCDCCRGQRPRCPARTGLQDGEKYKLFVGGLPSLRLL